MKAMRESQGNAALGIAIAGMFGIATFMAWIVTTHARKGETRLPSNQSSLQRTISRDREPALFWTAITVYALILKTWMRMN